MFLDYKMNTRGQFMPDSTQLWIRDGSGGKITHIEVETREEGRKEGRKERRKRQTDRQIVGKNE